MSGEHRDGLKDWIECWSGFWARDDRELGKRPDVALNGVMLILAELYADGVSDGAAFGTRSLVREIRATRALTGEDPK